MQIRNTKKNEIVIRLNDDCEYIESIDLFPKAFRFVDVTLGLLAKSFRPAPWGVIRHLIRYNGMPIFRDSRGQS